MFRMKVYRRSDEVLLAASDAELVGETIEGEERRLDVRADFYGSETVSADALVDQMGACTVANLVGPEVVTLALERGFVDEDHVLTVDGVPHAQVALMGER